MRDGAQYRQTGVLKQRSQRLKRCLGLLLEGIPARHDRLYTDAAAVIQPLQNRRVIIDIAFFALE